MNSAASSLAVVQFVGSVAQMWPQNNQISDRFKRLDRFWHDPWAHADGKQGEGRSVGVRERFDARGNLEGGILPNRLQKCAAARGVRRSSNRLRDFHPRTARNGRHGSLRPKRRENVRYAGM